ncbi:TolC family protein [Massilia sp. IC2-476]|uniref:TolC family protein n=1 Tax=Massilia sp. IC2-476 TaxID=2887199 RepID=UPI001D11D23F|nr:TolC family protein [Massilia sp. IC2-476]MCC2971587.1 TolC family protein [Massilia sp. IC2-476]
MKKVVLSLAIAGLYCAPVLAQTQQQSAVAPETARIAPVALTLSAAVERAMRLHPEIRAAISEAAAQAGAVKQAGVLPNPELEVLREGTDDRNRSSTVQLNIPLELGGKRSARMRAAEREQQVAQLDVNAVRARIRGETSAAFYEVVAALERSRVAGELAAIAGQATGAAGKRVLAGKVSPVEETRANVAQAGVHIEVVQAKRELDRAKGRLAALVGEDPRRLEIVSPGAVELPRLVPLPDLLSQLERAPGVLRARAAVEHRQAVVDVERARRMPDVTVAVGSKREEGHRQTVLGLSVPLPLFDRNQGSLLESLRRTDKARDELDAEASRLRAELYDAHARLSAALEEVALISTDVLPGAESAYRAASRGFELGKFSFLEVLDAQRTLFQSKNQYLLAVAESYRASADIDRLIGTITPAPATTSGQEQ